MHIEWLKHRWRFFFAELFRKIWFRCGFACFLAIAAFVFGSPLSALLPDALKAFGSQKTLLSILSILASTMLAVTTFALGTVVQSTATSARTATPRAARLVMEDRTATNALSAFLGAFLFSMVGLTGLSVFEYDENSVSVLFVFTILIIALVVTKLIQWIKQLSRLGRISVTIELIEQALLDSIDNYLNACHRFSGVGRKIESPRSCISTQQIGYVAYIDHSALETLCKQQRCHMRLLVNAGDFLTGKSDLAQLDIDTNEQLRKKVLEAIVVERERTFYQDPRYGVTVLAESGLRALSPSLNDPGTATHVLGSFLRCAQRWQQRKQQCANEVSLANEPQRLIVPMIDERQLLEAFFIDLLREVIQHISVAKKVQELLTALRHLGASFSDVVEIWQQAFSKLCEDQFDERELALIRGEQAGEKNDD